MRNYSKTIGALAAASALVAGNASAFEVEYELHTGYTSEYLFRGLNLGQDLTEVGVDAATEINGIGLSAGAWYGSVKNGALVGSVSNNYDELDLYAEVSKDLGFLTAAVGYIYYYYPSGDFKNFVGTDASSTAEVYFSVARDFGFLDASLAYYWDVKGDNDGYLEGGVSKGFELSNCLTLNTGATLGYLVEEGDLGHLTAKVSLDYAVTETATFSPFIAHSWALEDGSSIYSDTKNQFVGGAMLSVGF